MLRATLKLVDLPFARMPVGMAAITLAWAACTIAIPFAGAPLLIGVGIATWIGGLLVGMALYSLAHAESLLLPHFRRHLAEAGAAYALAWIGLPLALAAVAGVGPHVLLLAATALLLAPALGLAAGTGMRVAMFAWIVFPLFGLLPKNLHAAVIHVLLTSPWTPVLALLLAAALLAAALRPLLAVSDARDAESPLQAVASGRRLTNTSSTGAPQRRGLIGKKLALVLDGTARRNLAQALAHFQRVPSATHRMRLIRAVLLPHDNVAGIALNTGAVVVFIALYVLLLAKPSHGGLGAGYFTGYAILLGMSRFTAVGAGLLRMRPNLADLYLTLAPATHREFQATLADALLWLVAVTVFNMLAFTVLIAVMLHAPHIGDVVIAIVIVGTGAAFAALGAYLIGPTSKGGRVAVQLALSAVAIGIYEGVLWLMRVLGVGAGGLIALVVCVPVGLWAWRVARGRYLERVPCFDAPIE